MKNIFSKNLTDELYQIWLQCLDENEHLKSFQYNELIAEKVIGVNDLDDPEFDNVHHKEEYNQSIEKCRKDISLFYKENPQGHLLEVWNQTYHL